MEIHSHPVATRLSHLVVPYRGSGLWSGLCSVLRPRQHSIHVGYTGDGFYRSEDPTNSIKVLKKNTKEKSDNANNKNTHIYMHTKKDTNVKDNKSPSLC